LPDLCGLADAGKKSRAARAIHNTVLRVEMGGDTELRSFQSKKDIEGIAVVAADFGSLDILKVILVLRVVLDPGHHLVRRHARYENCPEPMMHSPVGNADLLAV